MTIFGEMPQLRRYFHRFASAFMCAWFGALILMSGRFILQAVHDPAGRSLSVFSFIFAAIAIGGFGSTVWFHRRMVSAFSYDSRVLNFRTLGISKTQMRPSRDIASIREWRGRQGLLGYVLLFCDQLTLYIEYSVSNSAVLAQQIRLDLEVE
jgi:hypothetical protein